MQVIGTGPSPKFCFVNGRHRKTLVLRFTPVLHIISLTNLLIDRSFCWQNVSSIGIFVRRLIDRPFHVQICLIDSMFCHQKASSINANFWNLAKENYQGREIQLRGLEKKITRRKHKFSLKSIITS